MTTQLEVYKFQAYKQRQAHDIDGVRPVMIPDDDGDWVDRHTAEHLVDMLLQANKRITELEGYKTAYMEWSAKTDWVQKAPAGRFGFISLGMHLADVMTQHIEQLETSQLAVPMPRIKTADDYVDGEFTNEDLAMVYNSCLLECKVKVRNAGGTVQGDE